MQILQSINSAMPKLPSIQPAHWLIRIPIAGVILQQASFKFPLTALDAEANGLPFFLWALAAIGEVGAGLGLLIGGLLPGRVGDILTRVSAASIAIIVMGVIYVVYWAPLGDILIANQLHILLLVGALFLMLRGNETYKRPAKQEPASNDMPLEPAE
ncbi:MAG: hypothetical protein AAGI92_12265 [Pseudomonadota bacterium]